MASEKFLRLLETLIKGTEEGKIRWQETADEHAFRVIFEAGLVRIEQRYDNDDETGDGDYSSLLVNKQGQVIDSLWSGDEEVPRGLLRKVYVKARASALQADEILEKILRDAEAGKTVNPRLNEKFA